MFFFIYIILIAHLPYCIMLNAQQSYMTQRTNKMYKAYFEKKQMTTGQKKDKDKNDA